jgi:hypothetical protein
MFHLALIRIPELLPLLGVAIALLLSLLALALDALPCRLVPLELLLELALLL